MSRRHLVFGSAGAAATAAAVILLVAAIASAGTSAFSFQAFGGPTALTTGQQGVVFAKFTPDPTGGTATHTVITFNFPTSGTVTGWAPDPATSSDCAPSGDHAIACSVGVVHAGVTVKRFITFNAGSTTGNVTGITAQVSFDGGNSGANGGGAVNGPAIPVPFTIVDGSTADGKCKSGGATVLTAPVSKTVLQQTALTFGNALASLQLPCSWGTVSVINQQRGPDGAPEISSVGGPSFAAPSTVKLSFSSLPKHFVLMENENFDPANPSVGWFPVPPCPTSTTMPPDLSVDACLVGISNGKTPVATLLYRGTGVDPWFN